MKNKKTEMYFKINKMIKINKIRKKDITKGLNHAKLPPPPFNSIIRFLKFLNEEFKTEDENNKKERRYIGII